MDNSFALFAQFWCISQKVGPAPYRLPKMHREIVEWLDATSIGRKNVRRLLMAYRHAGKSYLVGLYVAWRLSLDSNYTCLIVSAGADLAEQNSSFIRQVIETHPMCRHLVPEDQQWQRKKFNVRRSMVSNISSVNCKTMKGQITGFHGDEIILDDAETSDNASTEGDRKKIARTLEELNATANNILAIGTPHHEESIYKWMLQNTYRDNLILPFYDESGNPRNPEMGHDEEWIAVKRENMGTPKYESQFLLKFTKGYEGQMDGSLTIKYSGHVKIGEPDHFATDPIRSGQPTFWIERPGADPIRIKDLRAYYDPATGLRNRDNSVLAVVCKDDIGNVFVLECVVLPPMLTEGEDRFVPQFQKILEVCKRTLCNTILVEKNFSMTLASELRKYATSKNARVRIKETVRTSKQHKADFIGDMIEPLLKTGRLYVHEEVFTDFKLELEDFPYGKHDDRIDAVAGAIAELVPTRVDQAGTKLLNEKGFHRNPTVHLVNKYEPRSVV